MTQHRVIKHPNKYKKYKFNVDLLPAWLYAGAKVVPTGGKARPLHTLGMSDPVPEDEEEKTLLFGKEIKR